jgi:hypothetical protein
MRNSNQVARIVSSKENFHFFSLNIYDLFLNLVKLYIEAFPLTPFFVDRSGKCHPIQMLARVVPAETFYSRFNQMFRSVGRRTKFLRLILAMNFRTLVKNSSAIFHTLT